MMSVHMIGRADDECAYGGRLLFFQKHGEMIQYNTYIC